MKVDPKQVADKMRRIRSNQPPMTSAEMRAQINQHQRQGTDSLKPSNDKPSPSTVGRKAAVAS